MLDSNAGVGLLLGFVSGVEGVLSSMPKLHEVGTKEPIMEVAITWFFLGSWILVALAGAVGWVVLAARAPGEVSLLNE